MAMLNNQRVCSSWMCLKDPPKNTKKRAPLFVSDLPDFFQKNQTLTQQFQLPELPTPLAQLFQDVLLAVSEECFGGMWVFYNDKLSPLFSIIPK